MPLYEVAELDEAMNAIKEEMMKDCTDALIQEKFGSDYSIETIERN